MLARLRNERWFPWTAVYTIEKGNRFVFIIFLRGCAFRSTSQLHHGWQSPIINKGSNPLLVSQQFKYLQFPIQASITEKSLYKVWTTNDWHFKNIVNTMMELLDSRRELFSPICYSDWKNKEWSIGRSLKRFVSWFWLRETANNGLELLMPSHWWFHLCIYSHPKTSFFRSPFCLRPNSWTQPFSNTILATGFPNLERMKRKS